MGSGAVGRCAHGEREQEAYYTYQVFNQAIVVPETIDAIRALTGLSHRQTVDSENRSGLGDRQRISEVANTC